MLQTKIFEGPDAQELQIQINDWFKDHLEIEVLHIAQSESAVADPDGDLCGNTTISLFYQQKD